MTTDDDNFEDDNLLESLGHLFAADAPQQPSPAELAAFRNLFAADSSAVIDPTIVMSTVDPTSTIKRPDVVDPTVQMNTVDATAMMARPMSVDATVQTNTVTMNTVDGTIAMERTERVVVPFARPARRLGRRLAITGVVAVIGLTGTTALAAAANQGALPRPVRILAHGVGLPVDSVELADAKHALSKLRKANDAALPGAVAGADDALSKLSDDDRRRLGQPAAQEVDDARGRVNSSSQVSNNSGSGSMSGGNAGKGSGSGGNSGSGSGSDDAPTTVPTRSGESTPATTAESNSGKGGSASTTVTIIEDNSGKGKGGDSSTTTIASGNGSSVGGGSGSGGGSDGGSPTTETTAGSGSGSGGASGGGGSGGGGSGSGGGGSSPPTTTESGKGGGGGSGKGGSSTTTTTTRP